MIKNYFKIAWRSLLSQKLYSFINISGLAVGLAVCMIIMLLVAHEHSYDNFHKNADRIFVPNAQMKMGGTITNMEYTSYVTGSLISQSQPTVESYMRTLGYFRPIFVSDPRSSGQKIAESKLLFADPGFFNFFSFKLLSGQPGDVLKKPFSVVISAATAKKYFGNEDPIGKTMVIKTDSAYTYQVTGVAENAPSNSTIDFNFVASTASLVAMKEAPNYLGMPEVGPGSFDTYLLLKHASDTSALRHNLNLMVKNSKLYSDATFSFTAIRNEHFKGYGDSSNLKYVKIFPVVALLILLLALVNYMSLSTARATLRAKEVGVRKVSGASRQAIAGQFYIESTVFTCISFGLGYLLCYIFTPWFLNLLQLRIDNSFLYSPLVLSLLFALLIITILIAGSYPSVVLSAFKPVITLKGKMSRQAGGITVRKIFTTLQFTIAVGLVICGIVIDRQLYFFRHADTGINKENVVMIPIDRTIGNNYPALLHDMRSLAGSGSVATSHYAMFASYDMYMINGKTKNEDVMLPSMLVTDQFINTVGLKWKYPPLQNTDLSSGNKVILNEIAVEKLQLPANPVGTLIQSGTQKVEVAGVVKNFNFTSMEYAMQPLGLFLASDTSKFWSKWGCNIFVRIKPHTNLPTLVANMQSVYKKYDQETPFSYSFMDDAFNAQYKAEDRLASIFSIFTVITIILATLGLFGLAAFTIQQRSKEIGVRKILGASLTGITSLLTKDFLVLLVLAIVIASPIAWWAMHSWLQNFAYRITIQWWVFATAGLLAVVTAIITVSYHALQAAVENPVKSLRSE